MSVEAAISALVAGAISQKPTAGRFGGKAHERRTSASGAFCLRAPESLHRFRGGRARAVVIVWADSLHRYASMESICTARS